MVVGHSSHFRFCNLVQKGMICVGQFDFRGADIVFQMIHGARTYDRTGDAIPAYDPSERNLTRAAILVVRQLLDDIQYIIGAIAEMLLRTALEGFATIGVAAKTAVAWNWLSALVFAAEESAGQWRPGQDCHAITLRHGN